MSCDVQRGIRRLSPAGAIAWQRLADASRWRLVRLRRISWQTIPWSLKALLLVIVLIGLLLLIIVIPQWQAARWEGRIEAKEVAK